MVVGGDQIRRPNSESLSGRLCIISVLLVGACREVKLNGCNKCFGVADVPWPAIKREHRGGAGTP